MLMLGFRGTEAASLPIVTDIRERHLGSVVLFAQDLPSGSSERNILSPGQLRDLCAGLQAEAATPLLIATDQEGGAVERLGSAHGFPPTRSARSLGDEADPAVTEAASLAMAETLREAGVNLNLAPVVDVNTYPANPIIGSIGRSFSADPQVVAAQAAAFIKGHHEAGILTTLKHFPGHGSSRADTHAGFVDVTTTWDPLELVPYAALIPQGVVDAVMVAHVFNANLDPERPASLSELTIAGQLRGKLGFDGVVVSDDLEMGAIAQQWTFEEAIRLAVNGGTDILAFSNNLTSYDDGLGARASSTLSSLVERGDVPRSRIEQSYARIQSLKARLP